MTTTERRLPPRRRRRHDPKPAFVATFLIAAAVLGALEIAEAVAHPMVAPYLPLGGSGRWGQAGIVFSAAFIVATLYSLAAEAVLVTLHQMRRWMR